jgi:hypothetical protein
LGEKAISLFNLTSLEAASPPTAKFYLDYFNANTADFQHQSRHFRVLGDESRVVARRLGSCAPFRSPKLVEILRTPEIQCFGGFESLILLNLAAYLVARNALL